MNKSMFAITVVFISTIFLFAQPREGDKAVDFSLPDTAGNTVSLSDFKGDVVLLNFFATWCGPCQIESPMLEDSIWQAYKDKGLTIIGLDFQEETALLIEFIAEYQLTYPMLRDTAGQVFNAYGLRGFPTNFIINREGTIAYFEEGFNIPVMQHKVDSLLNVSSISDAGKFASIVPKSIELISTYPNPFNSETSIKFRLNSAGNVNMKIFDITGREITSKLYQFSSGEQRIQLNMNNSASGIYFFSLNTEAESIVGKLILQK